MRLRPSLVVLAALAVAGAAGPSPAAAASGYCSPTGDYCYSAPVRKGAVRLVFSTFSFRGRMRVCVRPPAGGTPDCRTFRLRRGSHGIFLIDARWSAHFPRRGPGTYRATFAPLDAGGAALGPGVTFRRRG